MSDIQPLEEDVGLHFSCPLEDTAFAYVRFVLLTIELYDHPDFALWTRS